MLLRYVSYRIINFGFISRPGSKWFILPIISTDFGQIYGYFGRFFDCVALLYILSDNDFNWTKKKNPSDSLFVKSFVVFIKILVSEKKLESIRRHPFRKVMCHYFWFMTSYEKYSGLISPGFSKVTFIEVNRLGSLFGPILCIATAMPLFNSSHNQIGLFRLQYITHPWGPLTAALCYCMLGFSLPAALLCCSTYTATPSGFNEYSHPERIFIMGS